MPFCGLAGSAPFDLPLDVCLGDPVARAVGLPTLRDGRDADAEDHPDRPEVAAVAHRPDDDADEDGKGTAGGDAFEVLLHLQALDRKLARVLRPVDPVSDHAAILWADDDQVEVGV